MRRPSPPVIPKKAEHFQTILSSTPRRGESARASTTAQNKVELWPLNKLVPYARNPRKIDAAVDRMAASIQEFGFKIPVLARSSGEVVDGYLRLKAAHKLSIAEIPVLTFAHIQLPRVLPAHRNRR